MINPVDAPTTIESDTRYAYLPAELMTHLVARHSVRPLSDAEAEQINGSEPKPELPAVAVIDAEEPAPAKTKLKGK